MCTLTLSRVIILNQLLEHKNKQQWSRSGIALSLPGKVNAFNFTMRMSVAAKEIAAAAGGLTVLPRTTLVLASVKFHLAPDASDNATSRDSILPSSHNNASKTT